MLFKKLSTYTTCITLNWEIPIAKTILGGSNRISLLVLYSNLHFSFRIFLNIFSYLFLVPKLQYWKSFCKWYYNFTALAIISDMLFLPWTSSTKALDAEVAEAAPISWSYDWNDGDDRSVKENRDSFINLCCWSVYCACLHKPSNLTYIIFVEINI